MAASTTTTLNDVTYAAAIVPTFIGYAHDFRVIEQFLRVYDARGRGSAALDIPQLASNMGTINDGGTGVDTEFDGTEGTDLTTTTTQSTNKVTVTASEYAVFMTVMDNVGEDTVPEALDALMNEIFANAAEILMTAFEDDVWALLTSLNGGTAVGTTTVGLTLANVNSAIVTIRNAGIRAPDGAVACFAPIQATDFEDAVVATGSSQAIYGATADRYNAISRGSHNGLGNGYVAQYRDVPIFMSGLADFANASADRVGGVIVPSTPGNDRYAALCKSISRELRIEMQRDATLRGDEIVASMRYGSAEHQDAAGVPVVTDA